MKKQSKGTLFTMKVDSEFNRKMKFLEKHFEGADYFGKFSKASIIRLAIDKLIKGLKLDV